MANKIMMNMNILTIFFFAFMASAWATEKLPRILSLDENWLFLSIYDHSNLQRIQHILE